MTADQTATAQKAARRSEKVLQVPVAELIALAYKPRMTKAGRGPLARQLRAITDALPGISAIVDEFRLVAEDLHCQAAPWCGSSLKERSLSRGCRRLL
jgi:hypothetical protein